MITFKHFRIIGFCGFALLAACGGGGGSSSSSGGGGGSSPSGTLVGTAATGNPIVGAAIVIEDSSGTQVTGTTDTNGNYSLDTSTLTPPLLVQVTPASGPVLYSVSADASPSVINVTPLTDLIVRSWYAIKGTTAATAFSNPGANPPPTVTEVGVIEHVALNVASLWLQKNGIDPSNFNLISTAFSANGTGADAALNETTVTVNTGSGTVTAKDSTTTQTSTVTFDSSTSTVTVSSSTTSGGSTSTSSTSTVVPTTNTGSQVVASIQTALDTFANMVNTKGTSLAVSDVAPYVASTLLDQGLNASQFEAQMVSNFSSGVTLSFQLLSLDALDTTNNTATATFQANISQGGQTQTQTVQFQFVNQNGNWLINGDRRYAYVGVQAEERHDQGAQSGAPYFDVNVDVESPQGIIATGSPTVSGAGFGSTPIAMTQSTTIVDTYGTTTIKEDHYYANSGSITPPTAGTPVTVAMTANSTATSYQFVTNAVTNEAVTINGGSSSVGTMTTSPSSIAYGSPLTLTWTLPTTYAIARVKLEGSVYDGPQGTTGTNECFVNSDSVLSTSATSGSITIPSTCNGNPVQQVNLSLSVTGTNGERSLAIWFLQ